MENTGRVLLHKSGIIGGILVHPTALISTIKPSGCFSWPNYMRVADDSMPQIPMVFLITTMTGNQNRPCSIMLSYWMVYFRIPLKKSYPIIPYPMCGPRGDHMELVTHFPGGRQLKRCCTSCCTAAGHGKCRWFPTRQLVDTNGNKSVVWFHPDWTIIINSDQPANLGWLKIEQKTIIYIFYYI